VSHFILPNLPCSWVGMDGERIHTLFYMWQTLVDAQIGSVGGDGVKCKLEMKLELKSPWSQSDYEINKW
jgi:hypothetical protein